MNSLISIIIPTYNRADMVVRAIKSVVSQTASNWELIIVDDGSTDDTKKKIAPFRGQPNISYIFYKKNKGVSFARNEGLAAAKGGYIIFLDSDDYFKDNVIERLNQNHFLEFDIICWWVLSSNGEQQRIKKPRKLEGIYGNITAGFVPGSVAYRKKIIEKVNGFDINMEFGENYEMAMRIAAQTDLKIKLIDEVLHIYRIRNFRENSQPQIKIKSLHYLYNKHTNKYLNDPKSHSRLVYQLGFLYDRIGETKLAKNYYRKALKIDMLYIKAWLRNICWLFK